MRRGRDGKETGCRDWRLEREELEGFAGKHFVAGNVFCQDTLCGETFCGETFCGRKCFLSRHILWGND